MPAVMLATFLCSLAGGMLCVLGASRIEAAAHRWVRLIGIIAFALSVTVGVWAVMRGRLVVGGWSTVGGAAALAAALGAAVIILIAPLVASNPVWLRVAAGSGGACGVLAAWAWSMTSGEARVSSWLVALVGQALGSFLLGSVTVAWLLGHAYLTATAMTIAPLRRLSALLALAVALRWAFLLTCVGLAFFAGVPGSGGADDPGGWLAILAGAWLVLSLRVLVGLVAVSLFTYMVWDCVKIRSTQSATGILYFASVFVYIGELASQHLLGETGIPM